MTRELHPFMQTAIAGWGMPTSLHRWLIFNSVGAMGFLVQLAMLELLTAWLRWNIVPATALAVETAVIHNFFWHEHWTWSDRGAPGWKGGLRRFLRFNLSNGFLSIAGNLVFTVLFLDTLPVNYVAANVLAIAVCSILNYVVSDRFVFRSASIRSSIISAQTGRSSAFQKEKEEL
jgi:putative flippase GtrA